MQVVRPCWPTRRLLRNMFALIRYYDIYRPMCHPFSNSLCAQRCSVLQESSRVTTSLFSKNYRYRKEGLILCWYATSMLLALHSCGWVTCLPLWTYSAAVGIIEDVRNRRRLSKLLRVYTTRSPTSLVSIGEYIERMQKEQSRIFFLCSTTDAALRSPYLERFQEHGLEVIIFTDPVDEYMLQVSLEVLAFCLVISEMDSGTEYVSIWKFQAPSIQRITVYAETVSRWSIP